jgi:UDP-glucose 4-epimerase
LRTLAEKSVLVTGGAGFIGSSLCDGILSRSPRRLAIVDDFSLGKTMNIDGLLSDSRVKLYCQDATDYEMMEKITREERCDVVFNLAVIPLPRSLEQPRETVEKNILITTTLCELLRRNLYRTLIHTSSSEAYGSAIYVPMDEKHPGFPLTPYAASKLASDHVVLSYARTFGLDVAVARPFNAYGPRQNDGSYAGVIPITIKRLLNGKPPVIFGDGLQTRDYTYVDDTVEGILGVFHCEEAKGQVVNIATASEIAIKSLIDKIVKVMGYRGEVLFLPDRPGDVRRHRGDISLAKKLFGYSPKVDFETGLGRTVEWYRGQSPHRTGIESSHEPSLSE